MYAGRPDHQILLVYRDGLIKPTVGGVKLCEMRVHLGGAEIIDRNNLNFVAQLRSLVQSAQYIAAYPPVSVNCHVEHRVSFPLSVRFVVAGATTNRVTFSPLTSTTA